jgi:hypothetical protein
MDEISAVLNEEALLVDLIEADRWTRLVGGGQPLDTLLLFLLS